MSTTEDIDPDTFTCCWPEMDDIYMAKVLTKTGITMHAVAVGMTSTPSSDRRLVRTGGTAEARELAVRLIEEASRADEEADG